MKGKALVMVGILVLGVAISGPIQVAAAYEHNWSWLTYRSEAHNWSAFGGEHKQHNWSALEGEHKQHNWSNVLHKVEDKHDWSGVLHKHKQHNWSAFEGEREQHDWSWMLPEPGATFNPNAGWWGIG